MSVGFAIKMKQGLANQLDFSGTLNDNLKEGLGANIGFKPRLEVDSSVSEVLKTGAGGKTIYYYSFTSSNNSSSIKSAIYNVNKYGWLNLIDLTGCYLASTSGTKTTTGTNVFDTISQPPLSEESCNRLRPTVLVNVLSHEIDIASAANTITHTIAVDGQLHNDFYRILQPNPICIHKNFDTSIRLYELNAKNTINPETKAPYESTFSYYVKGKKGGTKVGDNEGVLSMFVIIDTDGKDSNNTTLVSKGTDAILDNVCSHLASEKRIAISDGDIVKPISVQYENTKTPILVCSELETLKGIVSLSEILKLTVSSSFDNQAKRCVIGTTVQIGEEVENMVNDLLEAEGIEFTNTAESYGVFDTTNIRGTPLINTITHLLDKKNKQIDYYDNTFRIIQKEDIRLRPEIHIDERSGVKIFEYEKTNSNLDLFNEIIVYGNTHKAIRKDVKSIEKHGRKTLEISEEELATQESVDKRALNLLLLHTQNTDKINITVSHKNVSQIRAGDVINFGLKSEGIEKNLYTVLAVEYTLKGLIKLELGAYNKNLDGRLSELLIENKKTKTTQRLKNHPDASDGFNFLEQISIREIRATARKRTSNQTLLGFATTLNTTGIPLGFEGEVFFVSLGDFEL